MADARLRQQIAFEAARMMYERVESEYYTAKRKAARLLRRLDLGNDADRILALTRSAATTDRPSLKRRFDCPTFWAAFQLIGHVA